MISWLIRIINSFLGIRKKNELENDLANFTITKVIVLFLVLNVLFISIIIFIVNIFI